MNKMRLTDFDQKIKDAERKLTLKDRQDISFVSSQISQMVRLSRIQKGYTQKQLADKMGKKQSSVARLETGKYPPTISFLNDIAKALDTYLIEPRFHSIESYYANEYIYVYQSNVKIGETNNKMHLNSREITNPYRSYFTLNLASSN